MKYQVAFITANGFEVRGFINSDTDVIDSESAADILGNEFTNKDFIHFVENGKLVFVNMRNVACVRVSKVEEKT